MKVFLSYTTHDPRDSESVREIASSVQSAGIDVFMAPDSIPKGHKWEIALIESIMQTCSHLVVYLSASAFASDYVQKEIQLGLDRQSRDPKFLILPILVGVVPRNHNIDKLREFQGIDFNSNPKALSNSLITAIRRGAATTHARNQDPPLEDGSWKMLLRSMLREIVPEQLRSRDPWSKREQESILRGIISNPYIRRLKSRGSIPHNPPAILTSGNKNFERQAYRELLLKWKRQVTVYIAPANAAAAAVGLFLRDVLHVPISLNFSHVHGVAIVEEINRGNIAPDAFFAGDTQVTRLQEPYDWVMALGSVQAQIIGAAVDPARSLSPNGIYLFPEASTLELSFEQLLRLGKLEKKKVERSYEEPSKALDRLVRGDPYSRSILWPPNLHLARLTGKIAVLKQVTPPDWNTTLLCSKWIRRYGHPVSADVLCAGFLLGWRMLKEDELLCDLAIKRLVAETQFSETARASSGFDLFRFETK